MNLKEKKEVNGIHIAVFNWYVAKLLTASQKQPKIIFDLRIQLDICEFLTKILCTTHLRYTVIVGVIYIFPSILNFIFILIYIFIVFLESWWITIPLE